MKPINIEIALAKQWPSDWTNMGTFMRMAVIADFCTFAIQYVLDDTLTAVQKYRQQIGSDIDAHAGYLLQKIP